ncbi:MAG: HAD family hydrolase [Dokdonella sp.]
MTRIDLVAFDADDTLWRSQEYFDDAQTQFESIMAPYIDLDRSNVAARLYATESRNIALFGYGAKGMTLSMIEAAITLSNERISATHLHRIVELGKAVLQHRVELLPGIRDAVAAVAATHRIILVTKGDLFHQEAKVAKSGLADLFTRIEIVSEKNRDTYARVLRECDVAPEHFVMIGNSMRSDIEPVIALGGYGIYMPYHSTWTHETVVSPSCDPDRVIEVVQPSEIPGALQALVSRAE